MRKPIPLAPGTWITWLGVAVVSFIWLMPRRLRNALALLLAKIAVRVNSGTNRAIAINLHACFPEKNALQRHQLASNYLATQFQASFLLPRLWWGRRASIADNWQMHGQDILDKAIAGEKPVVLLITHSVALDAGLVAMSTQYAMEGIYKPLSNDVLDWLVMRARSRFGGLPVARGDGLRSLLKSLSNGKLLCYLSDEDLGPKGSVFAPFFSRQKCTLAMLPRIVKNTNAVVLPMIAHHNAHNDVIEIHILEPLKNYPSMDALADATELNSAIEQTIRINPEQYMWNLRLFKSCPDGKLTRYGQIERGEIGIDDL